MRRLDPTLAALVLLPLAGARAEDGPIDPRAAWLRQHAIALDTHEPGSGVEDLRPIRALVGDARLVALGECTHGSREIFRMKHRLLEFLASEMGFTIFSIEANMPEAYAVDAFVQGGDADPEDLIRGMYFWTWSTEEVADMVRWMRDFNAARRDAGDARRIVFTGFDMQTPDVAARIVGEFLAEHDPASAQRVGAVYEVALSAQVGANEFGVATGTFPIAEARGKTVRFSGSIKTEDVRDGFAGLWWRVDGADGGTLAFDNMADRGPRGTIGWRRYALELDVPEEAVNINFGVLMPGRGTAWFDDLTIELDGQAYEADWLDGTFEGPAVAGLGLIPRRTYESGLDGTQAAGGAQSLRIRSLPRPDGVADASESARETARIVEVMERERERYAGLAGERATDWAIQMARVVNQAMRMRAGDAFAERDRAMAENVAWILKRDPEARIVLWAHNGHVAEQLPAMGAHLARMFEDDYLSIAFATGAGRYTAIEGGKSLADHPLQEPPEGSFDEVFAGAGIDACIVDLRRAEPDSEGSGWLTESRPWRSIGAMAMDQQYREGRINDRFDAVIWIAETSPAVQLGR